MVDIPFFESYTEDSVDFLINLGFFCQEILVGWKRICTNYDWFLIKTEKLHLLKMEFVIVLRE